MTGTSTKLTLWGVEVFVAVVEEGSISAAARRLGASVSAISQQITNLEEAVGAHLMDRSTRPVTITPAGHMFRRRAQVILNETAQAKAELALADFSQLTNFRLGMIEDFDALVTPRLLAAMAEDLKECQFLLETGASHRLLDALDSRALDVVVTADMGDISDATEVHPLLEEPFVLVAPKGKSAALKSLRDMAMIQYSTRCHMGRQINAHLARENLRPTHQFELDSYHAILAMVAQGAGWSLLTPLGALYSERFRDQIEVSPLPTENPLTRKITLTARAGILGDMPEQTAQRLRELLDQHVVAPACQKMPWLDGKLRLL